VRAGTCAACPWSGAAGFRPPPGYQGRAHAAVSSVTVRPSGGSLGGDYDALRGIVVEPDPSASKRATFDGVPPKAARLVRGAAPNPLAHHVVMDS